MVTQAQRLLAHYTSMTLLARRRQFTRGLGSSEAVQGLHPAGVLQLMAKLSSAGKIQAPWRSCKARLALRSDPQHAEYRDRVVATWHKWRRLLALHVRFGVASFCREHGSLSSASSSGSDDTSRTWVDFNTVCTHCYEPNPEHVCPVCVFKRAIGL